MVNTIDFEPGRKKVESLLNTEFIATKEILEAEIQSRYEEIRKELEEEEKVTLEWVREYLRINNPLLFVRAALPEIVGRGTHQIVLDLGNSLVAKVGYKKFSAPQGDFFQIQGGYSYTQKTLKELRGLGFYIPDTQFYRSICRAEDIVVSSEVNSSDFADTLKDQFDWKSIEKIPNICLTLDLRDGGKYRVVEYDKEIAEGMPNAAKIIDDFNNANSLLRRHYGQDATAPFFQYEPHKVGTPEEAILKLFLLQVPVDRQEEGKLVLGDFDHVYIYR